MDESAIMAIFDNELRSRVGHERFTANSFLDLLGLLRVGALRVVDERRTDETSLELATSNLDRLLITMADARDALGYSEFREDTLWEALSGRFHLCPLWPFCD